MTKYIKCIGLLLVCMMLANPELSAQEKQKPGKSGYAFTIEKSLPVTAVKDQHRSGTCWSFATVSFIESELLRIGKGEFDLSEMYFVRKAYEMKAEKYVRMQGTINFGPGGLAMDVMRIWKESGMVPDEAYDGLTTGDTLPVHNEMDAVLKGYMNQLIKNPNRALSPVWNAAYDGILDAYLGKVPDSFTHQGATHTPLSFATGLGLDPNDYIAVGSFTHHPFYEDFIIEIPDNWLWNSIKNVSLDEMMEVLDNALNKGYTVCWDADVSEKGYDWSNGLALMPSREIGDLSGLERANYDELSDREKEDLFYDFSSPRKEKKITQTVRQEAFDNYQTEDNHLMHIFGTARDQQGNKYYLVKNSWGTGNHVYAGYHYVSEAYMRAKTIFLMVHKEAVPASISGKLEL